jgi:hypothetical protein
VQPARYGLEALHPTGPDHKGVPWNLQYTVQVHRGHVMRKMQADSFAALVRLAGKLQLETPATTTFGA